MATPSIRFFNFAAPSRFYALAGWLTPWLWAMAALLAGAGLYIGFFDVVFGKVATIITGV